MADAGQSIVHCPDHRPTQHRDGKPPWCRSCGLTEHGGYPIARQPRPAPEPRPVIFDRSEQPVADARDDLVTAARIELAALIDSHDDTCDRPSCDWSMHLADAVLVWVESRYVPTSAVLDLAQQWQTGYDEQLRRLGGQPEPLAWATRLRALTRQETP